VTRFSGRPAPLHPGGVPGLPDDVTREAYSHQVSSAGFWPGDSNTDFPTFYSYAYPAPRGFAEAPVAPERAYFDQKLGEFLLPYEVVQTSADPGATLMAFLKAHIGQQPTSEVGIVRRSNVPWASPSDPDP
jgi:hypothetical protein